MSAVVRCHFHGQGAHEVVSAEIAYQDGDTPVLVFASGYWIPIRLTDLTPDSLGGLRFEVPAEYSQILGG